jgi:hypothetical protein
MTGGGGITVAVDYCLFNSSKIFFIFNPLTLELTFVATTRF